MEQKQNQIVASNLTLAYYTFLNNPLLPRSEQETVEEIKTNLDNHIINKYQQFLNLLASQESGTKV